MEHQHINGDHFYELSYQLGWAAYEAGEPDSINKSEAWRDGWEDAYRAYEL